SGSQSSTVTLSISGLIPLGSAVYPGTSYYYSAFIGSTQLTLTYSTSVTSTQFYASGGSFTGTFTSPSYSGSLYLNVTYSGSMYSSSVAKQNIVVSTLGGAYSSGSLQVVPVSSGTYEIVGYGYYLKNPTVYYMKYSGETSVGTPALTNGAFAVQISLGSQPAGTYSAFTVVTNTGSTYFVSTTYSVSPNMTLSSSSGNVGSTVTLTITGLQPTTQYYVDIGNTYTGQLLTGTNGAPTSSPSVTVPALAAGDYSLNVVSNNSDTVVLSHSYTVKKNLDISLGTDSQQAFPTEIVSFSVKGLTAGSAPSPGTGGSANIVETFALVYLNNSLFAQVPAQYSSSTLTGYFQMPNSNPGSFYSISFGAIDEYSVKTETASASSLYVYSTDYVSYTGSSGSDYLGLISGNGAFVTGITQSQIAQLETDINTTLSIPVSELEASVSTINGDLANINTAFGTMNTTLSAIDAKVVAIDNGIATITTVLGTTQTTLSSINATLVSFNGSLVTVATTAGKLTTSLIAINATLVSITGNTATISTDLGIVSGKVTSISNGIATIQTSLGTIQTNTNQILPPGGTSFLLEIVILVLIVITVVFSALFLTKVRKD
ncbi:MAG: hypothetical protein M0Z77_01650, partial [Thermoplasmatales archaeon]|nr:hypothetical protein [Thermoplasmatales archaeon]